MNTLENDTIRSVVRENYGQVATTQSGCCAGASCCSGESSLDAQDISQAMGYSVENYIVSATIEALKPARLKGCRI